MTCLDSLADANRPPPPPPPLAQLETDNAILIPKARGALNRYGHQIVVGNLLNERKHEVVFVEKDSESWVRIPEDARGKVGLGGAVHEIEEDIVEKLVGLHDSWIEGKP